jgi:hypothetical protein
MASKRKSIRGAVRHTTEGMMQSANIPIKDIRLDGGTQIRVEMNPEVVEEYAELMKEGTIFPPLEVFDDGENKWLVDGFHRIHAAKAIGNKEIKCQVLKGTQREAILRSVEANKSHGLRRTNKDKRNAVITLLNDEEWQYKSSREIAEKAGVGNNLVARIKNELDIATDKIIGKDGKEYSQDSGVRKAQVKQERTKFYRFKLDLEYKDRMSNYVEASKKNESALLKEAFEYLEKKYGAN